MTSKYSQIDAQNALEILHRPAPERGVVVEALALVLGRASACNAAIRLRAVRSALGSQSSVPSATASRASRSRSVLAVIDPGVAPPLRAVESAEILVLTRAPPSPARPVAPAALACPRDARACRRARSGLPAAAPRAAPKTPAPPAGLAKLPEPKSQPRSFQTRRSQAISSTNARNKSTPAKAPMPPAAICEPRASTFSRLRARV